MSDLRGQLTEIRAWLNAIISDARTELVKIDEVLASLEPAPPARVQFDSPVGTDEERAGSKLWPGRWVDLTGFLKRRPNGDIHPSADLNLPNFADTGEIIHATADGIVRFSGQLAAWGYLVVVEHLLEDGLRVWSRYAHLNGNQPLAIAGEAVQRGDYIGVIGDYGKAGPQDDHVDFSIARKNLTETPGDWPGPDAARAARDYFDPLLFVRDHHYHH